MNTGTAADRRARTVSPLSMAAAIASGELAAAHDALGRNRPETP
jgi:hypothetical protein